MKQPFINRCFQKEKVIQADSSKMLLLKPQNVINDDNGWWIPFIAVVTPPLIVMVLWKMGVSPILVSFHFFHFPLNHDCKKAEKITSDLSATFQKMFMFPFSLRKRKNQLPTNHTPPPRFSPPKKKWKPRPMPRKPRVSPASFSQLSPQPRPERKATSPWRMGFSGSLAHGEYGKSPRPGVVELTFCLFVGL